MCSVEVAKMWIDFGKDVFVGLVMIAAFYIIFRKM